MVLLPKQSVHYLTTNPSIYDKSNQEIIDFYRLNQYIILLQTKPESHRFSRIKSVHYLATNQTIKP